MQGTEFRDSLATARVHEGLKKSDYTSPMRVSNGAKNIREEGNSDLQGDKCTELGIAVLLTGG